MRQKVQEDRLAVCSLERRFYLSANMCYLEEAGGTYHINSCEPIEVFYNLRIDLDKLQYAAHITKIIEDITNENDSSFNILQLLLNTLYTISETEMDKELVLAIFKIRLLSLIRIYTKCYRMCKLRRKRKFNAL